MFQPCLFIRSNRVFCLSIIALHNRGKYKRSQHFFLIIFKVSLTRRILGGRPPVNPDRSTRRGTPGHPSWRVPRRPPNPLFPSRRLSPRGQCAADAEKAPKHGRAKAPIVRGVVGFGAVRGAAGVHRKRARRVFGGSRAGSPNRERRFCR